MLLTDGGSDNSRAPYSTAGVEYRLASTLRFPACAAAAALAQIGDASYASEIASLLSSRHTEIVVAAAAALGDLAVKFEDQLLGLIEDARQQVRIAAIEALGKIAACNEAMGDEDIRRVAGKLNDKVPAVRAAAALALAKMGPDECAPYCDLYLDMLSDRSPPVRVAGMKALASAGPKGQCYAAEICRAAVVGDANMRACAAETLAEMGERGAAFANELAEWLGDLDDGVREAVLNALGKMGDDARPFLAAIESARGDPSEEVRIAANRSIGTLTQLSIAE